MAERVIGERYVLESKIGSGGMGTVWKAQDQRLNRTVAVKLLHEGLTSDASFGERFRREARAVASLTHPNVAAVYDTGEENGTPYIVMEYVDGESLHRMLQRQGPLPVEDAARIARSVLGALHHAHSKGLIHRDMKPANVLFDSTTGVAKVVDFGIAKGLEDTGGLTRTSGLIGTAAYLSPEQVSGDDAQPASDLYGVGCLLFCCLAGEPPFSGPTAVSIAMRHLNDPVPSLRRRRPDVPADFEAIVMRALAKDPTQRFTSAQAMDDAIEATGLDRKEASTPAIAEVPAETVAMRQHPVGAAPQHTEAFRHERAPSRSGPRWLPALTAFLVVAAIGAVFVLYMQSREVPLVTVTPQPTAAQVFTPPTEAPTPSASPSPTPDDDDDEGPPQTPSNPFGDFPVIGD
jgi:serine/threonine-protein kinase